MSTKTLAGLAIYNLKQEYNSKEVIANPSDGDVYVIDLTSKDKAECERWSIREVDGEIDVIIDSYNNVELTLATIADALKIRKGEVVKAFNVADEYLGSLVIKEIDETTGVISWGYAGGNLLNSSNVNVVEFDLTTITYIQLQTDNLLTDGQCLTLDSAKMPYFCVFGLCKFTIISMDGILEKK